MLQLEINAIETFTVKLTKTIKKIYPLLEGIQKNGICGIILMGYIFKCNLSGKQFGNVQDLYKCLELFQKEKLRYG